MTFVAPRSKSRRASTSGGRAPVGVPAEVYVSIAMPVIERFASKNRISGRVPVRIVTVIGWPMAAA